MSNTKFLYIMIIGLAGILVAALIALHLSYNRMSAKIIPLESCVAMLLDVGTANHSNHYFKRWAEKNNLKLSIHDQPNVTTCADMVTGGL